MKSRTLAASMVLLVGLAVLGSAEAYADVIYTYTGRDFTTADPPYTLADRVTGYFTLSQPLGDGLQNATITPLSFSFSDGVQTITNLSANVFAHFQNIYTDGSGMPTAVFINITADSGNIEVRTPNGDSAELFTGEPLPHASSSAGGTFVVSTVPEPASAAMFGAGLLGLVLLHRQRKIFRS